MSPFNAPILNATAEMISIHKNINLKVNSSENFFLNNRKNMMIDITRFCPPDEWKAHSSNVGSPLTSNDILNGAMYIRIKYQSVPNIKYFLKCLRNSTSKLKHIQTYYSNFMGNTICHRSNNPIPPIPPYYNGILVVLRSKIHRSSNRGETLMKIAKNVLVYTILKTGALTQGLLGFCIYSKVCGWRVPVMALLTLLVKTTHIITILKSGGGYGYIS